MSLDVTLTTTLFEGNITHNLCAMAKSAGIDRHIWDPEEVKIFRAKDLIIPLQGGLNRLRADPDKFKKLNPENGWGDYDGLVKFVESYLTACRKFPHAEVKACC